MSGLLTHLSIMFYPCSWLLLLTIPHKDIDKCVQIDHDCLIVPLLLFCALNAAGVLVAACLVVFVSVSKQHVSCYFESIDLLTINLLLLSLWLSQLYGWDLIESTYYYSGNDAKFCCHSPSQVTIYQLCTIVLQANHLPYPFIHYQHRMVLYIIFSHDDQIVNILYYAF